MRNINLWKETKYSIKNGKLIGSRNPEYLSVSSRLFADIIAECYDEALKNFAHGDLLDLGCGYVPLYGVYSKYVESVTCVDWENTFHKNEFLDKVCDLNKPLPLEDKKFDTVILSDVLEHIFYPDKLLGEIHRIMRNNGYLIMNTPFLYNIHEEPYDYYRYTQYAYEQFAKQLGFEICSIIPLGSGLEVLTDMLCKFSMRFRGPSVGNFLSECFRLFCVLLGKTIIGKKIYRNTSSFTLGYFVVMKKY
jgi:SAM-dependent methyltransferase